MNPKTGAEIAGSIASGKNKVSYLPAKNKRNSESMDTCVKEFLFGALDSSPMHLNVLTKETWNFFKPGWLKQALVVIDILTNKVNRTPTEDMAFQFSTHLTQTWKDLNFNSHRGGYLSGDGRDFYIWSSSPGTLNSSTQIIFKLPGILSDEIEVLAILPGEDLIKFRDTLYKYVVHSLMNT